MIPPLAYNIPVNVLVPVTCKLLEVIRLPVAVIVPELEVFIFPFTSRLSEGEAVFIPTLPPFCIVSLYVLAPPAS